jgi:hypothetical protein
VKYLKGELSVELTETKNLHALEQEDPVEWAFSNVRCLNKQPINSPTTNQATTMKKHTAYSILLTASILQGLVAQQALADQPILDNQSAKVFLVDDQSGEELSRAHGIAPIQGSDLEILVGGVVASRRPVTLFHELIDEDASDNEVRILDMKPFTGGAPPTKPSQNLPLRQLVEETEDYRQKRALWVGKIRHYHDELQKEAQRYVHEFTVAQVTLEARFDEMLAARNGRDFNRSDVGGTMLSAGRHLGTNGLRFAVLNTDAEDLPGTNTGKRPRSIALSAEEFDPGIVVIFVNTSGLPQNVPLFKEIPNPTHHVLNMAEAMELICQLLTGGEPAGDAREEGAPAVESKQ